MPGHISWEWEPSGSTNGFWCSELGRLLTVSSKTRSLFGYLELISKKCMRVAVGWRLIEKCISCSEDVQGRLRHTVQAHGFVEALAIAYEIWKSFHSYISNDFLMPNQWSRQWNLVWLLLFWYPSICVREPKKWSGTGQLFWEWFIKFEVEICILKRDWLWAVLPSGNGLEMASDGWRGGKYSTLSSLVPEDAFSGVLNQDSLQK